MDLSFYRDQKVAIIIPCYNEAIPISNVIKDCQKFLPQAQIHVFDNNSTDDTVNIAKNNNAIIHHVKLKGKGNVVRRMFADIEADIYLMIDGDATYDLSSAKMLIDKLIDEELDMVIGKRIENDKKNSRTYRKGHRFGNLILTKTVSNIFGGEFSDMLSGYRVFTKRFAKSFPIASNGFEIETELTIHALELKMKYAEVETSYVERPAGSSSKLSTYKDGVKILFTIINLYATERPFFFYSIVSFLFLVCSLVLFLPIFSEYLNTGLVPRLPSAILSLGLILIGFLLFFSGMILQAIKLSRYELKLLAYLKIPLDHSKNERK